MRREKAGKSARDKNKARAQCECVGDAPHSCVYRTKGVCLARDVIQRETGGYQGMNLNHCFLFRTITLTTDFQGIT
jgi:hypothetical protein